MAAALLVFFGTLPRTEAGGRALDVRSLNGRYAGAGFGSIVGDADGAAFLVVVDADGTPSLQSPRCSAPAGATRARASWYVVRCVAGSNVSSASKNENGMRPEP